MVSFWFFLLLALWILSLQGRIKYLEDQAKKTVSLSTSQLASVAENVTTDTMPHTGITIGKPATLHALESPSQRTVTQSDWVENFGHWMREESPLKLGALLILIGFGWFVSYAFMNNWIGSIGRITFGLIVGSGFLVFGWLRAGRFIHQGSVFLVFGSTIVLLTLFAARQVYDFFTPVTVLVAMFLSVTFIAMASVRFSRVSLATASLVLGALAPLLTNTKSVDYIGLFLYIAVLVIGTVWIIAVRGWRILSLVSLLIVFFYSIPHLLGVVSQKESLLIIPFIYAFAVLFFAVNTKGILTLEGEEMTPDLVTAFGNGLLLIAWILAVVRPESMQSFILLVWTLVFLGGAFAVFLFTKQEKPFFVYSGVSIVLLGTATATLFSGATLVIAYTLEAAAIILTAAFLIKEISAVNQLKLVFIVPIVLSFESMVSSVWHTTFLQKHFFVLLTLAIALVSVGCILLRQKRVSTDSERERFMGWDLIVLGSLYIFRIIWLSFESAFSSDTAVMLSLVVYTLIGLISYFRGRIQERKTLRLYGVFCLGFVILRLFLVDVWEMGLEKRIVTFAVVGLLLMSTAFIGKKKI